MTKDYEVEIDLGESRLATIMVHGAESAEDAIRAVTAAGWRATRRVLSRPPASITVPPSPDAQPTAVGHVAAYTRETMATAIAGGSLLTAA